MSIRWLFAVAAVTLGAFTWPGIAQAADIAAPVYKAQPAPVSNWTGFYLGASAGVRWSRSTWTGGSFEPFGIPAGTYNNPADFDDSSARLGFYGGFNWQIAPLWVVGVEADGGWGNSSKTAIGIPGSFSMPTIFDVTADSATVSTEWDAGVRGRIGFLVQPNVMLFASGGAAWQRFSVGTVCSVNGPFCGSPSLVFNQDFTKLGWSVGAGVEAKIAQSWLARVEYRYASFGEVSFMQINAPTIQQPATLDLHTHTLQVGVAYQF